MRQSAICIVMATTYLLLGACTSQSFSTDKKKTSGEQKKKTQSTTTNNNSNNSTTNNNQNTNTNTNTNYNNQQSSQPNSNTNVNNNNNNYVPTATPTTATPPREPVQENPPVTPPVSENVKPPVNNISAAEGSLYFNAILFTNMEKSRHASDSKVYAVVRAQAGNVVAAGPLTLASAINGKPINGGGAYPATQLNVALTSMDKSATSGSGTLSVCNVVDTQNFECVDKTDAGGDERPASWVKHPVQYVINGKEVSINNTAYGQLDNVKSGLSFSHPIAMAAIGADVNDYVDASSPLVLDLNKNGKMDLIALNNPKHNVKFDLSGKGEKRQIGWISGAGDGLLALDINGDNLIDNGSELFGEYSYSKANVTTPRNFENGFLALAQYDQNRDGVIDAKDAIFTKLKVWVDKNTNGVSEKGELLTLKKANVQSINLRHAVTGEAYNYKMVEGNEVRFEGSFKDAAGKTQLVGDIWFAEKYEDKMANVTTTKTIKAAK